MANSLPDEILSEILSPALKVPDDAFSDNTRESPFAGYSESSSAFLLVSKAWLRVSTPLLYHVVVIRSKAQASALEKALRGNPTLGRFIKKLRVEGGYGASMLDIIKSAPNVTDLFLTLNIWSNDTVGGLVRGLPLMNPTRVILSENNRIRLNKNSQLLHDAFVQCLRQWQNLAVVDLPWNHYYPSSYMMATAGAIQDAPNVKTVITPAWPWIHNVPAHLALMAKNPSVSSIQFKNADDTFYRKAAQFLRDPSLRGLVRIPELMPDDLPSALSPQPSEENDLQFSTAAVTEDIWKRILSFCMVLEFDANGWPNSRIGVLLVSKQFARLSLPYFYATLHLHYSDHFSEFVARLDTDTSLRSHVRTLYMSTTTSSTLEFTFPKIKLVHLIGRGHVPSTMKFRVFKQLIKHWGPTLVELVGIEVGRGPTRQNPSILSNFDRLRSLSMAFKAIWDVNPSLIPSDALANLEELSLSTVDETMVVVLAQMDLPALRHASFSALNTSKLGQFFAKHGSKLHKVAIGGPDLGTTNVFDLCPRMVELTVYCGQTIPTAERFTSSDQHASLKTITLKTNGRRRGAEHNWKPFFRSLSVSTFPALEQVVFPHIKWPTTEHDIQKSAWVDAAEALLDCGVKLTDSITGVSWRRRLKKR